MEVEMRGSADGLEVLVRDRGCGLQPHASEPSEIGGIGMPVMLALADSVEFAGADGGGPKCGCASRPPRPRCWP